MATSIREVARIAGVHPSSVSRALSGDPGVSAEKRREIHRIARKLGYVRDRRASDLRSGRRSGIVVVVEPVPTEITAARNQELYAMGADRLTPVSVVVHGPGASFSARLREAMAPGITGVIVSGVAAAVPRSVVALGRRLGVALVTIDGHGDTRGMPGVDIDRSSGTREVADYFLSRGFRLPLYVSTHGPTDPDARLEGILAAYQQSGLSLGTEQIIRIEKASGYDTGYRLADEVIARHADAVFAYNDRIAIAMLRRFRERDIRVPDDVCVVGFDDLEVSRYIETPLSTVSQPVRECAAAAFELIGAGTASRAGSASGVEGVQRAVRPRAANLTGAEDSSDRLLFPTRLVLRATTPAPE